MAPFKRETFIKTNFPLQWFCF